MPAATLMSNTSPSRRRNEHVISLGSVIIIVMLLINFFGLR